MAQYPKQVTPQPNERPQCALYGVVPAELAATVVVPDGAQQCDPRRPGAMLLEDFPRESLEALVVHAPPGTLERRYALAHGLAALKPGAPFTVFAANTKGGARLPDELRNFGCAMGARPKRRHQIVQGERPRDLLAHKDDSHRKAQENTQENTLEKAIAAGAPRFVEAMGLYSQPGVFSWDRLDPGSQLLIEHLPILSGRGADLGCGIGVLSRAVIEKARNESRDVELALLDCDIRALRMAQRNLEGAPVTTLWRDIRTARDLPARLDFVVMNPPFHDGGTETRDLGRTFIERGAAMLSPRGVLWMTANRQLAYEKTLAQAFGDVEQITQQHGYKIYRAAEPRRPVNEPARGTVGQPSRQNSPQSSRQPSRIGRTS